MRKYNIFSGGQFNFWTNPATNEIYDDLTLEALYPATIAENPEKFWAFIEEKREKKAAQKRYIRRLMWAKYGEAKAESSKTSRKNRKTVIKIEFRK